MSNQICGKNLTDGMVVTKEAALCFSFTDATGCLQQGIKTVTPNPADPENPIVVYTVNGVVIPKPDNEGPCLEQGTAQPVVITGNLCDTTDLLRIDLEIREYCNPTTLTKWEKHYRFVTTVVGTTVTTDTQVILDVDTGFPCTGPIVVEQDFCKV